MNRGNVKAILNILEVEITEEVETLINVVDNKVKLLQLLQKASDKLYEACSDIGIALDIIDEMELQGVDFGYKGGISYAIENDVRNYLTSEGVGSLSTKLEGYIEIIKKVKVCK